MVSYETVRRGVSHFDQKTGDRSVAPALKKLPLSRLKFPRCGRRTPN
jgi:hypothetical protein